MSQLRPTPRDGEANRPPGPPGDDDGVIPIRALPPRPSTDGRAPTIVSSVLPRSHSVPVEQRPWRVLLVPPTPGAPTRAFHVARWQAKLAVAGVVVLVLLTGGALTALVLGAGEPDRYTAQQMAILEGRLLAVEDSLSDTRADIARTDTAPLNITLGPRRNAPKELFETRRTRPAGGNINTSASASDIAAASRYGLPAVGAIASRFSQARAHPILRIVRPHLGVDVAAPRGTRITAPAAGRVTFVGRKFAFGLVIEIEHPNGVMTRYAHCRSALVRRGEQVSPGDAIATVGSSGLTTGPHLHYEVLVRGNAVDPLRYRFAQPTDSAVTSAQAEPVSAPLPSDSIRP